MVNLSRDSQFLEQDDSMKMEIYSGKTLSPANLSNEYNRIFFLIFRFLENRPLECCFPKNVPLDCCFPENRLLGWKTDHMTCFPLIKCSEKNKMDNSQNGYSSVENTGKIKKNTISSFFVQIFRFPPIFCDMFYY